MKSNVISLVQADEPEFGDGDGDEGQVVCPVCDGEEFHIFDDPPHGVCQDCGCEIDLPAEADEYYDDDQLDTLVELVETLTKLLLEKSERVVREGEEAIKPTE